MNLKYQRLLNLLDCCEYKINEISAFRIFNSEYSKIIENSQLCILEKHVEIELIDISQMFEVSKKSAVILYAMFFNSFVDTEGLVPKIVSEGDLALSVCLDSNIISELKDSVLELERKNILKINSKIKSYVLRSNFINTIKL